MRVSLMTRRNKVAENREAGSALVSGLGAQAPTLTERLTSEREALNERLRQIDDVLQGLARHPETAALLDAVAKLGHMRY